MARYTILYNPTAGNGAGATQAEQVKNYLTDGDLNFFDMTAIASYADFFAENCDTTLVICGGDGTLNRFINDTQDITVPTPILYFAAGSGNDFLKDIGGSVGAAPVDITKYLSDLPEVTVNGKTFRFLNNVGFGIDGYCCEVGDKLRAVPGKKVNYTGIAIKGLLFHFHSVNATVTIDGETTTYDHVWLVPTMNGRFYGGGMIPTPEQDRLDPEHNLSVMVFRGRGRLRTLMAFPSIFKGEHVKHTKMVKIMKGKEVRVTFDRPTALQIDGETIVGVTEYSARSSALVEKKEPATV